MSDGFVWLSYIATYGLIVGYVLAMLGRVSRGRKSG